MKRLFLAVVLLSCSPIGCAVAPVDDDPLPEPPAQGLLVSDLGREQQVDLSSPFAPGALAAIAVVTNPELQALRLREAVAGAQIFAAGLYPDPVFSVGFDEPVNGDQVVTALAASIGIDLAAIRRRPIALAAARANRDVVRLDIAWAEWLTGEQARLLALRIAYLERTKALTSELRRLTEDQLARAVLAVTRGDLSASDLEARRLAATDAADRDRSTESQLDAARLALNQALGVDPAESVRVARPGPLPDSLPSVEVLFRQAVGVRADLAGLRAAYEASRSAVAAAELGRYPLPVISINAARDTSDIRAVGPAVSFTLPLWNRGRGDVAVAQATRVQLRAEYAARLEAVRADIAAARSALAIATLQHADVARNMEPLIPQSEAAALAARRGDLPVSAAETTRITLLDKQIVENVIALAIAEFTVALEIAAGQPLELQP